MRHAPFVARPGKKVRLKDYDPGFTAGFRNEQDTEEGIRENSAALAKYQDILMAHETYGVLVLFQAMDGAGKDSTIKHVMSSLDPQGCEVKMFKDPTEKELRHDYLWRSLCGLPARGQVGIFNRSYYEHVVTDRIHPEKLDQQGLPKRSKGKGIWKRRYMHINNLEQYLFDEGILVLKFFLHMSREKQVERLLERVVLPEKKWKFSESDIKEREYWDEYMRVYEEVFSNTSTRVAPWYIIPDDNRWFARAAVASIVVGKLKSLHSRYPVAGKEESQTLAGVRRKLEREQKRMRGTAR